MHTQNKAKKLIKAGLYAAIIGCAAGAATGTYAWYSYQKDVEVSGGGTTIKVDKEIQVGLRFDSRNLEFEAEYDLGEVVREDNVKYNSSDSNSFVIYWARGNYLSEILKTYHRLIGSAQGKLNAITAGKYEAGWAEDIGNDTDTLAPNTWNGFKETPTNKVGEWDYQGLVSNKKDYFYLPLVFRAMSNEKGENGSPIYLNDVEIFLTQFSTQDLDYTAGDDANLAHSVRCKVDYPAEADTSKNFIFDPNAAADNNLEVGGVLNLNFDRFYDSHNKREIPYGQWEEDPIVYAADPISVDTRIPNDECTTFYANHQVGIYPIDRTQSHPSTCQTKAASAVIDSAYTEGKGIVKTAGDNKYGYVDLSIYLEGWDSNVVNNNTGLDDGKSTDGHTFAFDLEFSIN